jgi:hypothetical protein
MPSTQRSTSEAGHTHGHIPVLPETVNTFQGTSERLQDSFDSDDDISSFEPQPTVVLSPEQQKVLQMVKDGRNVFFTGSAGLNVFFVIAVGCS